MELLHQLGINQFAIIQFFMFIGLISFLSIYVFAPYLRALEEREKRTKGGRELAGEYQEKTNELGQVYQTKAREVTGQISEIFQKRRSEAMADHEKVVGGARQEAQSLIEKNRQTLSQTVAAAATELKSQSTVVAMAITNKLLGK